MSPRASNSQIPISKYFSPPSRKRAGSEVIDLTQSDSDDAEPRSQRAQKRARTTTAPASSQGQRAAGRPSVERWRFTPSPLKTVTTGDATAVLPEVREAFRRKLLTSSQVGGEPPSTPKASKGKGRAQEPQEEFTASPISSGLGSPPSDGDQAFNELTALFPKKSKGKKIKAPPVRKVVSKAPERVGPSGQTYTPLEEQILKLKADNPGTLLMVEIGYKYKFFGEDAEIASKTLGVACYPDRNFSVAFIPVDRLNIHLKNLLSQGHRVGIVQQTETAALKKVSDTRNDVFERKLTHLYTAATYVDEIDSVDDTDKYISPPLMCLIEKSKKGATKVNVNIAMITVCPHTGDVTWDEFEDGPMRIELETRLAHTQPAELLLPAELSKATEKMLAHFTTMSPTGRRTPVERFAAKLSYTDAFKVITEFYTDKDNAAGASESFRSGELLATVTGFPQQVVVTLGHAIKHLSAFGIADAFRETKFFTHFMTKTHMLLAANTLANLEIYRNETDFTTKGSLISVLDRTKTKFGARLLRHWVGRPLIDKAALEARVDAVEELKTTNHGHLAGLQAVLSKLPDLAKGLCRIQYGQCTPRELALLLRAFQKIGDAFVAVDTPSQVGFKSDILNDIIFALPKIKQPIKDTMSQIILKKAEEGKRVEMWTDIEKFPELNDLTLGLDLNEVDILDELKAVQKALRRPSLKWASHLGEECLIELKKADNIPVPDDWIFMSGTKIVKRYHTPQAKRLLQKRAQFTEAIQREAHRAYISFLKEITDDYYGVLRHAVNQLAIADCLLSLTKVALENDYSRPEFIDGDALEIVDGRHPMIEKLSSDPFVANSVDMGVREPKSKIITGPNMGGKSSCVRMVALIVLMAQIGSYVPAASLKLGLVDAILTRMGASDDLSRGRSTFMVEMTETSEILQLATQRSLVILDELGRGTSTFDGMAIASGVLQHLVDVTDCKTLFITHYPSIARELEDKYPSKLQNLHMRYDAEDRVDGIKDVTFFYSLTPGLSQHSFGVECGRLAGLPESILQTAAAKASSLQIDVERRKAENRTRKAVGAIRKCFFNPEPVDSHEVEQLLESIRAVHLSITFNN
ncbi:Mismatch repair protein msh3 [Pleurotus ostreatus]|nr:Mismatch repair protein msh3 [Pleurotus ostreatus]